ncbi:MAG: hypothetical protein Q8865_02415 [Bacillota bacterium]|nr:hypothetical protein [Bacillota bacterium]
MFDKLTDARKGQSDEKQVLVDDAYSRAPVGKVCKGASIWGRLRYF